jgi:hypothetical protein
LSQEWFPRKYLGHFIAAPGSAWSASLPHKEHCSAS